MQRLALALGLIGILVAGPALARGGFGHGRGGHGSFIVKKHAERLGLDDARIQAIEDVVAQSREKTADVRQQLHAVHAALRELLRQDTPDEAAVMAKADELTALKGQLRKAKLASMIKVRSMLTPEQRAELVKIMDERQAAKEERRTQRQALIGAACAEDIAKFCPDTEAGPARGACLREHRGELSDACQGAMRHAGGKYGGCKHGCKQGGWQQGDCPHSGGHGI